MDFIPDLARKDPLHDRSGGEGRTLSGPARAPEPFLLPNPWDAGTARLLTGLGFDALGTTSLGVANLAGRRRASRQEILENCRVINEATPLPVNADLENGFADEPAEAAKMIEMACAHGAARCRGSRSGPSWTARGR